MTEPCGSWGRRGRPVAASEIFSYPSYKTLTHTGHSLSTRPLTGQLKGARVVSSRKAGVSLQPFPSAREPATNKTARLRQIKQLSRRFAAHEFWKPGNTRYELRMLPNRCTGTPIQIQDFWMEPSLHSVTAQILK